MSKVVAETLLSISENPYIKTILNQTQFLSDDFINECLSFWDYDLYRRKPGIAYNQDGEQYTTLDLATMVFALVQRSAVIYLPEYDKQQPGKIKSNEINTNTASKGECLGLTSNQSNFNFGLRIKDSRISQIRSDGQLEEGAYRTYLLTDMTGCIYDGWKNLIFVPTQKENDFLLNKNIWPDDNIKFENFVTPEKWISFYGQYYFIAKALIERLVNERAAIKLSVNNMLAAGVRYPASTSQSNFDGWGDTIEKEDYDTVKITSLEAEIDLPEPIGAFPSFISDSATLLANTKRVRKISKHLEKLRFLTRSIELAFANKINGIEDVKNFPYPSWIKNFVWEEGFKFPGKRTKWYRLKLNQLSVGEYSISIRFRWVQTTQHVNKK